jgi:ADP-heptose:LPS heptosyltransferase
VALIERVAVLRALPGLGDLLCAVPALRAIRAAHPMTQVTLIGLPGATWFAERFDAYVDGLLPLTAWPGLPEAPGTCAEAERFVERARQRRFDLALQLHGDGSVTNDLVARLDARRVAGSTRPGGQAPGDGFVLVDERASEVDRLLAVVRAAGIPTPSATLEWPERPVDRAEAAAAVGPDLRPLAVLHPGSSLPSRRWDASGFAAVGDHLARAGWRVVLTGVDAERTVTAAVSERMHLLARDLAGRLSLGGTAALVRRARLVVTNDTGLSHLAAAVGTRSVVVFTVTEPVRWKPAGEKHRAVVAGALAPTVQAVLAEAIR